VQAANPALEHFETSCFDGNYITGDVTSEYLGELETRRDDRRSEDPEEDEAEGDGATVSASGI
jgi:amidophosphoribosyltransferase